MANVRLVIRSRDAQRVRRLQAWLEAAGLQAAGLSGETAFSAAAPGGEDLRLVPAHEAPMSPRTGEAVATLAVHGWRADLHATPGVDGHLCAEALAPLAARAVAAHARALAARWELGLRLATAADRGVSAPPAWPDHAPTRILFVGKPGPAFLAFERAAERADLSIGAALTTFAAFDHLHDRTVDALVLDGREDPTAALGLSGALRRNADLQSTPTLFLLRPDAEGADAARRGANVLCHDLAEADQALAWLAEAARVERRSRAVDRRLAALANRTAGPVAGLSDLRFFESHLTRLALEHHACGRDLALAILGFAPAPGARALTAPEAVRAQKDLAGLTAKLLRGCDMAAAVAPGRLALALPGCDVAAARQAVDRVVAVGECTAFVQEAGAPPLAFDRVVLGLAPGESGPGLLSRALAQSERVAP